MSRDYRRFLLEDGRLNVRLVPRAVYIEMLNRHKTSGSAIDDVFEELRWSWDLNKRSQSASVAGKTISRADLAAEIIGEMDDREWWRATTAFEEHLIRHFADDPEEWSDLLNPVYDWQECEGWQDRHYAQFAASVGGTGNCPS